MKKLFLSACIVLVYENVKSQIFSQDFSSSSLVSSYVSASPNATQFTSISNLSNNPSSINSNALRFTKTGASSAYFARTAAFSGPPSILQVQFDFQVSNNPTVQNNNQATFYVGSNLNDNSAVPNNTTDFHSRFTFNFDATIGNFSIRDVGSGTNGNSYSGRQTITFIVNNSGVDISYTAPNGLSETLANDKWDLWIGNNKEFNDYSATAPNLSLSMFKFLYPSGSVNATIDFDNFIIRDFSTLPISLTSFTGTALDKSVLLNWKTASEENNDYFDVQHSADGKTFTSIGKVTGAGTSTSENSYSFKDENPFAGTNYYKLVQHDFDGKTSSSKVVAVNSNIAAAALSVYAAPSDLKITLSSPNKTEGTFEVFDIGGKKLASTSTAVNKGYNQLSVPVSLQSGVHFIRYTADGETFTQKFMK